MSKRVSNSKGGSSGNRARNHAKRVRADALRIELAARDIIMRATAYNAARKQAAAARAPNNPLARAVRTFFRRIGVA